MNYLLDTNLISGLPTNTVKQFIKLRGSLYVVTEVREELEGALSRLALLDQTEVQELEISAGILQKVADLMRQVGNDFSLISLFENKGGADVVMISHVLYEMRRSDTLFKEEWTIVTNDGPLTIVARRYGIRVISRDDFANILTQI